MQTITYPRITKHIEEYVEPQPGLSPYGMFGYKGASVERAIKFQDIEGIQKAHDLGWINPKTPKHMQTLDGAGLLSWVRGRNLPLSAEKLAQLGFEA